MSVSRSGEPFDFCSSGAVCGSWFFLSSDISFFRFSFSLSANFIGFLSYIILRGFLSSTLSIFFGIRLVLSGDSGV